MVAVLVSLAGGAGGDAYYNIVSVTSEQLHNAVRVTISSDGTISGNINKWWSGGAEADYYLIWAVVAKQTSGIWSPDCYPKVDKIRIHLDNARPQIGSVAHIGKYPISHVEFAMTPEKGARFGLDVVVVLHRPMRFRSFRLGQMDTWDAYAIDHHDPNWFEVTTSSDQRSLIITAKSDRLPEIPLHRRLEDVPQEDRELKVSFANGLLDVHARNVGLSELVEAVGRAGGKQMIVETATERLVTAELPSISPEDFAERISECYGLVLNGSAERRVLSDIIAQTSAAYTSGDTERIPVSWLKAEQARNLLPNFLLDYVRVDHERNSLVVSGSKALAAKVRGDLAKIDQPAAMVSVKAVVLETSSTVDVTRELALNYANDDLRVSADGGAGEISYSRAEVAAGEFRAKLQALEAAERVKVLSESGMTVASGEKGEIFAGVDRYIQFQLTPWNPTMTAEPVSAGVKLTVTPWTGGRVVTMEVQAEVTSVGEVDPRTRLPVINTRSATGTFRLRSGETVAIGGLSQSESARDVRKVPVLATGLRLVICGYAVGDVSAAWVCVWAREKEYL